MKDGLPIWERALALLVPDPAAGDDGRPTLIEFVVVLGLAVAAGLAIKVPEVFGYRLIDGDAVYARNLSLFVLPMLAGYFAWKRGLSRRASLWLVLPFVAAAVFANIFPFERDAHTESLTAIHLPFALWLVVGFAYVGGRWGSVERRTGLRAIHRRAVHLLRAHRARWRRILPPDLGNVRGHRPGDWGLHS